MPSPRVIGLTAAVAVLGLILPAAAQAAPGARAAARQVTLKPGASAQISLRVEGVSVCRLRIGRRSASVDATGAVVVSFRFRVAPHTRRRAARATIDCAPAAPQVVTLRIARPARRPARGTRRLIAGPIEASAIPAPGPAAAGDPAPPPGATPEEAAALADAQIAWDAAAAQHEELWRTGECTDWADRKRPDVVERVTVAKWAAEFLGRSAPPVNWHGGFWDETARAYGLPTGTVPRAGALVTWDPGVGGAGDDGHVGYVESVDEDGFVVSEMHAPERGVVTERRVALDAIDAGGIAFVY